MVYCSRCQSVGNDAPEVGTVSSTAVSEAVSIGGIETLEEFEIDSSIPVVRPKNVMDLIKYYPCCPPDAFINIKEFYDNPYVNSIPDNHKSISMSLRNWAAKLRHWRTRGFVRYYSDNRVKPYFNAYARPVIDYYFDVETSVDIANKLLLYQFDNEREHIVKFLTDLFNVIDFIIPKFNSMCIESPPSAGKNFFFDAVAAFHLNYGMFGTPNKTDNFSWMDGAGKRLVL